MAWAQLAVHCRHPEFAEELLTAAGAIAVTLSDGGDDPVLEPPPGATPLWRETVVRGLFDTAAEAEGARRLLRDTLPSGDLGATELESVEDRDWVRAWLAHARPLRFGRRLWICPTGTRAGDADAAVVRLDPGLAFGTGGHPSTALCLDWLARHELRGLRVLDYGCGSGVLAIAALRLGAAEAVAVDLDPQALLATGDNARRNRVAQRLRCMAPDAFARSADGGFDLVLANILARPLIELAPTLTGRLNAGGALVLAGLLERHADEVRAAYADYVRFQRPARRDGWIRLAGRRRRS